MRILPVLILCFVIFLSEATAKHSRRKHKMLERQKVTDELDMLAEDESLEEKDKALNNKISDEEKESARTVQDVCLKKHCGPGKECKVVEGEAICMCVSECTPEVDDRRKVCSNHNETWDSDCALYRMRCLCNEGSDECAGNSYKHVHIDYYGVCKDLDECTTDEMSDFPRRMREWLFNVLQDLARKKEMIKIISQLETDIKENQSRKWINAVIWKFCDLDNHPHDRSVSRHELFPLRAPLIAMEHCIAPFLDNCDANDDHIISLVEWGKCLGLEESEIEDKCAFLTESMKKD